MEIAILHGGNLAGISPGGVDSYVRNLILGLPSEDKVTVFGVCSTLERSDIGKTQIRDIGGRSYMFVPVIDDSRYPLTPRYVISLLKYRKRLAKFDVIFSQRFEFSLPLFGSKTSKKLLQIIHGTSKNYKDVYPLLKAWLSYVGEFFSITIARHTFIVGNREESGLPYYRRRYKAFAKRFSYAWVAVDLSSFIKRKYDPQEVRKILNIDAHSHVIIYVGRINFISKRLHLYPRIAKILGPSFIFVIVGDGPDLDDLKKLCIATGVEDSFRFLGYINEKEIIANYLSAADMSINISTSEGTCTSVLESLAMSVPVVSTDTGDIRQLLKNGKNGMIVPTFPEESVPASAARAIAHLATHPIQIDDSYSAYEQTQAIAKLRSDILAVLGKS